MHTFGFTRKKYIALPRDRQLKWVINWLKESYSDLLDNPTEKEALLLFYKEYKAILSWTGGNCFTPPETDGKTLWLEFISDCIHNHRQERGTIPNEYDFIPRVTTDDKKNEGPWEPQIGYKVALDGLRSVFNTGSIFRVCDAVGFESIILGKTLGKEHRGVQKTSMGSADWIPQEKTHDLAATLTQYREKGVKIIGVETVEGSLSHTDYPWPEKGIVVFGNEEYGISTGVIRACDDFVHIPMSGRKNSINVANAVSVVLFHIAARMQKIT